MASSEPPTPHDDPSLLRRLDRRVVPRLQRGARATGRVLTSPLVAVARWEERFARGRPLRFAARHRRSLALVATTLAVTASFVHLQRYPEIRDARRAAEVAAQEQSVRDPRAVGAGRDEAQVVGPRAGEDLRGYVDERAAALAAVPADQRVVAVVSLAEYATPEEVVALLPAGTEVRFAQYRVPAEGERPLETEVVGDDLVGSVARAVEVVVEPILSEIVEAETLLASGTIEDEAFAADLERRVSELEAVRNLLDSSARVVFAVVVEGEGDQLRAIAAAPEVRLVDVGDPGAEVARSRFFGLVPEEREEAQFGA